MTFVAKVSKRHVFRVIFRPTTSVYFSSSTLSQHANKTKTVVVYARHPRIYFYSTKDKPIVCPPPPPSQPLLLHASGTNGMTVPGQRQPAGGASGTCACRQVLEALPRGVPQGFHAVPHACGDVANPARRAGTAGDEKRDVNLLGKGGTGGARVMFFCVSFLLTVVATSSDSPALWWEYS